MSICTGSFVLAAAGLLDGRPATTPWACLDDFARLDPTVALDPDVLYVDDGDLLTSAGQFIDQPVPRRADSHPGRARDWALAHLPEPLGVPTLAARASMSVRTFTRRFAEETGQAPGGWLIDQRIHAACRLLETPDLRVDQVAVGVGLGSAASFARPLALRPWRLAPRLPQDLPVSPSAGPLRSAG